MESSNQILDALTSHLSLYHSASATASPSPNSNPRASILRWFSNLSIHQRQSHLTIIDSHFLKILLQMRARTLRNGHGFFFLLPDLPSTADPSLPTLCFRRSTGLLARSYAANQLEMEIFQSLRLFGSKDGVGTGECEIDAFTVCEEFVGDLDRFAEVMDAVSNGEFLSGEVDGVIGVEWAELPWLKAKGYYTLESFVANRIELSLRLAWMVNCSGGKKQKVMRLLKEKNAGMGVSTNVFWRRRGCMDWFLGLDPGVKKKVCLTFLRKGAKSLAREITESSDDSLKGDMLQFKAKSSPNYYTFAASHRRNEFPCRKDLEFCLLGIPKLISGNNSSLSTHLKDLIVLQQIVEFLFACQHSGLEAENIFFSTLGSTQTISDFIMRRLRGFLMVISSDCIEFELMTDTIKSNHMKKDEEKSAESSERSKRKPHKIASSNKKFSRNSSALQEPLEDYRCCRLPRETNATPSHPVLTNNLDHGSFSRTVGTIVVNEKDLTPELADNKSHISRKRRGRKKGKDKSSAVKETKNKGENPQVDIHEISSLPQDGETETVGRSTSTRSTSIDAAVLFSLRHQSSSFEVDNEADMLDVGVKKAIVLDCPSQSDGTKENEHLKNEIYQIRGNIANMNISNNECLYDRNGGDLKKERSTIPSLSKDTCVKPTTSDSAFSLNPKDTDSGARLMPSCGMCFDADGINHVSSSRSTSDKDLQASAPSNIFQSTDVVHCVSKNGNSTGDPRYLKTSAKGTSYEWPSLIPVNSAHFNPDHCPAAMDRLHLDIGHNQLNHFHQSFLSPLHPIINAPIECGNGLMVPPKISPLSLDCSLVARNGSRFCQTAPNYDPAPRLQSTLCSGIANNGMHFQGAYSDSEWRNSADVIDLSSYQNSSDMMDDTESRWMADEESDVYAHNGRDYSKYFGGGVMYWNTSDHLGTGFSHPPSHSSEDSSWAWYEADLNRAIDDMVGLPAYSVSSLTSPTAGSFCSPFESIGSGQQSLAYVISSNDVGVLNSQLPTKDNLEESTSGSLNISSGNAEGMNGDLFPYPILRPIITPSLSRKSSRSDFKHNHDHKSPCLPSTRRDHPRIKRPLSPVVLCVPHAPRVPPPSPVGESRKHKGFPVVRSGSSSPRHWGVKSWYHEDISSEDVNCCLDGPEIVWAAWANKSISGNKLMQGIPGSLLQDRLIAISQLGRDQEHPDVAFPVQPPGLVNSSSKTSVTVLQALLHEEINAFCKQVIHLCYYASSKCPGPLLNSCHLLFLPDKQHPNYFYQVGKPEYMVTSESQSRKPFINWAIKRVARSLQVLWPRSRTSIFGSNSTGLALPTSDVDLVVCLPPVRNLEPIKEAGILEGRNGIKETFLQHAARYLANQEWVKNDSLKTIENTAIPLIMLVAEVPLDISITTTSENIPLSQLEETSSSMASVQTCNPLQPDCANLESSSDSSVDADIYVKPIRIDISFKSSTHTGLQTTQLVRKLTEQFPASIPLALVLKQFLADRSLDHAYSGGLSSYCLVLLITRFLQHEHHLGRSLNQNLGILLMDFLYFFGNVFDPRQMRVSIQGSGLYMSRERGQSIDPIHIDDPLCPTNNVGRNCFRIHQCIKAFADAYSVLESEMTSFSNKFDPSDLTPVKLLQKIIPSIYHQEQT